MPDRVQVLSFKVGSEDEEEERDKALPLGSKCGRGRREGKKRRRYTGGKKDGGVGGEGGRLFAR